MIRWQMRHMMTQDIPVGMRLKSLAGWNQTSQDWSFLRHSPNETWIAVDPDGQIGGTISITKFRPTLAWIGMVLVFPEFRRQGLATTLMHLSLDRAAHFSCMGLDATETGAKVYEKLGFQATGRFLRMIRPARDTASVKIAPPMRSMDTEHLPAIIAFDQQNNGFNRSHLLQYLHQSGHQGAYQGSNDEIQGYCLCRPGSNFTHLGPLLADNPQLAEVLLRNMLKSMPDQPLLIDVPAYNSSWIKILERLGFTVQRSFIRMGRGNIDILRIPEQVFASAGPEFG